MKTTARKFLVTLALLAGLAGSANAVVTFTITPSTVSNTYNGAITFAVTGLTNGETVVVQKFSDLNTNGIVDSGDYLVQQFDLTDGQAGMVIGGVTNLNVPGDTNTTSGQITASLNFLNGDFPQNIVGKYLVVLSSPGGHFSPITNSFAVTNFPFAQKITGSVLSNSTPVPNAVVILFPAPRAGDHGPGNPLAGTVADNTGAYTIRLPAGTYVPLADQSGYVANYGTSPVLTLGGSQTITTNLSLTAATTTLSGQIVDAGNSSIGLPGVILPTSTQTGLIAIGFSDTNGNFSIGVVSGTWSLGSDDSGLIVHGYVGYNNGINVAAGTTGIVGPFSKATAMFYGTVKDNLGNPLAGIDVQANDSNNQEYQSDGYTDTNGNYFVGVVGGLGDSDPWQVQVSSDNSSTNYIYSQPTVDQNGGTNLAVGQALQVNFTAILATTQITGNVQSSGTNIVGVNVFASATINGVLYNVNADTDTNGNYTLNVANGNWSVGVSCNGGNDSLDGVLGPGNYQCPNNQNVTNSGTANFNVLPANFGQIFGYVMDTSNNPVTNVTVYATDGVGDNYSTNTDGSGYYSFIVGSGNWDVSVDCGQLNSLDYQCVGTNGVNVSDNSVEQDFIVQPVISQSLQITTTSLPDGTNGVYYSQTFQASGGTPPYNWSIPIYSAQPPLSLTLTTSGVLSGSPMTDGRYYFDVVVTDAASNRVELDGLALTILNNPPFPPVAITNVSLPDGTVGTAYNAQLGATGGQSPYSWSLALGSANPPPGLTLNSSGLVSGTPTASGVYYFQAQAADVYSTTTNKILSITVNAVVTKPVISSPAHLSGNQFQMLLNGAANQNYTVEMSTNLGSTNWITLYITNNPATNTYLLPDPNATNKQRFYRVLVGP
ncbi:MAG: hypothetical protein WBN22_04435 [Verrucomicrobiia bacterium]